MKKLLLLVVSAVSISGSAGRTAEFEVRKLGDGIVSIPVMTRADMREVFDFSKDGRYIWTSETNCYDLGGRRVEIGSLEDSSYPLPRMRWKKKFVGTDELSMWWPFKGVEERVKSKAKTWFEKDNESRDEVLYSSERLTFPAFSNPLAVSLIYANGAKHDFVSIARFANNDEIVFGPPKKVEYKSPIQGYLMMMESECSPDMRHLAVMMYNVGIDAITIMRADVESSTKEYTDDFVESFILKSDLKKWFGEDNLWICDRGHGFLNDNYYLFICNRGGRNSFTARDYIVVYGIREKRIVTVFKSHLRWLDQGCEFRDTDFVLSADEKYLAIRYDAKITIYPFPSTNVD